MSKTLKPITQRDSTNSKDKSAEFLLSILAELNKTEIETPVLASFIERAWVNGFCDLPWSSLLLEYHSIVEKNNWKRAFDSRSDQIIIDMWIKYGEPHWIAEEQKELLHSVVARFGAFMQIVNARRRSVPSKGIENILSPLLGNSDLPNKTKK